MVVTFYSNYLTHHQIPFCNAIYAILGDDFHFVSTEPMEEDRVCGGWQLEETFSYEIQAYQPKQQQKALDLAQKSDVVILGSAPELYFTHRMKGSKNLTFRYNERIYKNGLWRVISPRGLHNRINTYFRYRSKPLYMLCASAYTAKDLAMLGSYLGRCYKWGYFPQRERLNTEVLLQSKVQKEILWVGRMIKWKHPEMVVRLAEFLCAEKQDFHITMIGNGPLQKQVKQNIEAMGLSSFFSVVDSMSPQEVRTQMKQAALYLATSDFKEGWGAVINEAMNSGCAVIASHAMGSVPYLIQDGHNGRVFSSGNQEELNKVAANLLSHPMEARRLGERAYQTIEEVWNADVAAKRFVCVTESLLKNASCKRTFFKEGPCSRAEIIKNNWRK